MPEGNFRGLRGVLGTVVGYTGGTTPDPTYENMGDHSQALRIIFDARILPPQVVLTLFWSTPSNMTTSSRSHGKISDDSGGARFALEENQGGSCE